MMGSLHPSDDLSHLSARGSRRKAPRCSAAVACRWRGGRKSTSIR